MNESASSEYQEYIKGNKIITNCLHKHSRCSECGNMVELTYQGKPIKKFIQDYKDFLSTKNMTRRDYYAGLIVQASIDGFKGFSYEQIAERVVNLADALIKELDKDK